MSYSRDNLPLNPEKIRDDFPIFSIQVRGKELTFLDSAASSQKPNAVIDTLTNFYKFGYANIHRGVYDLSAKATDAFEKTRTTVKDFINARDSREIVFVRGSTEAINLVANSYGRSQFQAGDEIIISAMEHHANIVPWQLLRDQIGIVIKVIPINDRGELLLEEFEKLITSKTKLVGVTHVSNALGTINPIKEIAAIAHAHGVAVLVDGAQGLPHLPVDVQDIDCDFYTISGHKAYAPTGSGVLYGKLELLNEMPPYQGGGDMIRSVTFEKTTFSDPPQRFEAGTPDIAGVVGLGEALRYLQKIGMDKVHAYNDILLEYGTNALQEIDGLKIIGTAAKKTSVMSFVIDGIHPHDIGTILDREGVAVRTGHHCAQPVMEFFKIPATTRASVSLYNNFEDIDRLVAGLKKVIEVFK
jgi:cysteine desulfurase/selenocysteine lyase